MPAPIDIHKLRFEVCHLQVHHVQLSWTKPYMGYTRLHPHVLNVLGMQMISRLHICKVAMCQNHMANQHDQ